MDVTISDYKSKIEESEVSVSHLMVDVISAKQRELENGKRANSISDDRRRILHGTVNAMESAVTALAQAGDPDGTQGFEIMIIPRFQSMLCSAFGAAKPLIKAV